MQLVPVTLRDARRYVGEHHRHSMPPRGWRFGVAIEDHGERVGIGIAGRPVARALDDGTTIEILRVCTDGTDNACSMLYGALCRAAKALGYRRAYTYTLASEPGTSLKASGFVMDAILTARSGWDVPSRRRQDTNLFGERLHVQDEDRIRWRRDLVPARVKEHADAWLPQLRPPPRRSP